MRSFLMLLLLYACASSGTNTVPTTPEQGARLPRVKRLYLGDLGQDHGSAIVREKIRARLMASQRFDIVEERQRADAVLTGAAGLMRHGARHYRGLGIFRIVENRTGETIWSYEYKRGLMFGGSVSSRMADQVVGQLLQVAGPIRS